MEGAGNSEKDCGVLGGLFQTIVNDLRGSSPIWEDFTYKSMKLHSSLKTTVVAIGAFLEAFQKVADMATSSKGATKDIGSALTRLCMRHKSIEAHLKVFSSSILDNLVAPLQDKLEDWKKAVAQLDKDHAKEYKKAKHDIKKAASDTMRLQKKVRKGSTHGKSDMQSKLDSAMQDVNSKYQQLEETERNSVRSALIEERSRFCLFITCLKPFVDNELKLLTEITHLHEIMDNLCLQASDPSSLPASSEQVILDLKGLDNSAWSLSQPSPPSSPSSLGSRKSSMCSINSINSSSSGSSKSHSPSHTMHKRTASQPPPGAVRLTSVSSQDSGFTSQDTLFLRPNTPQSLNLYQASAQDKDGDGDCDSTPTTPSDNTPSASSTWNNWPNPPGGPRIDPARPHTISSTYEKGHSRPALKPDMFEPPKEGVEMRPKAQRSNSQSSNGSQNRPSATISKLQPVLPPHCPKPKVKAVAPPMLPPGAQPIYANMSELSQKSSSQSDMSPDDGEPTTPTTPASTTIAQIQQNTSLELAKAIRELEASTAALTSAYDVDNYNNHTGAAPASAAFDADSYTSKTSLQCSSGYGTMNSTPAGSEDTIASGGIPMHSSNITRRSSVNTQKPPPPVRRTASVTGVPPSHVQKLRTSPPKQMSMEAMAMENAYATGGGESMVEGPYAELQLIQQNIHGNQARPKQGSMTAAEALQYQKQLSAGDQPHGGIHPGVGGHYMPPLQAGVPPAHAIQSLNEKFASINAQYQNSTDAVDGSVMMGPPGQKPPPPAVMQKPGKPAVPPPLAGIPPPPSATGIPPSPAMMGVPPGQHYPQGHGQGPVAGHRHGNHQYQQHPGGHHPQHHPHARGLHQQAPHHKQPQHQHHPYSHPHHPHVEANAHHQHQQRSQQQHSKSQSDDELPLPPTQEELQEIERIYSKPPPINTSAPPPAPQKQTAPKPMRLPQQQQQQQQQQAPQDAQASLLMELKRRVSVDDSSNA